jgi:hypothetical protein
MSKSFLNSFKLLAAVLSVALLASGCAHTPTASVTPGTNLAALKTMYVLHRDRDNSGVNTDIVNRLKSKGVTVTTGDGPVPANVDAVVSYDDHWKWTVTMYLAKLDIFIKDPKSNQMIAQGTSELAAVTNQTQVGLVTNVIDNIYASQSTTAKP